MKKAAAFIYNPGGSSPEAATNALPSKDGFEADVKRKIDLTDWNNKENAEKWREYFATLCNQYLEKAGEEKRVDHRSYQR